ncbi:DEKNAAC105317 [Brettanomyces naardenensis]|uniref:DEKNAAC105317 n=1 Tax=Brettanomyces naardenensis TaxID=13370 RepID=A0A448YTQ3_BRENA|nr:DEKNAAC105317 [Brettanomyces naardenensis]
MRPLHPFKTISRKIRSAHATTIISLLLSLAVFKLSLEIISFYTNSVPLEIYLDKGYGPFTLSFYTKLAKLRHLGTEGFLKKSSAIKSIDELFDDNLEPLHFGNVTANPLEIIGSKYPNFKQFKHLSLERKAEVYVNEVIPECRYQFDPVNQGLFEGDHSPAVEMEKKKERWSELCSAFTQKELIKLGLTPEVVNGLFNEVEEERLLFNFKLSSQIKHLFNHLKFFGSLFLRDQNPLSDKMDLLCNSAFQKLFPWISGKYPKFTRFNEDLEEVEIFPFADRNQRCFIKNLQVGSKGRGIVISADDSMVPELSSLLTVLRLLSNGSSTDPIQIFYTGDTLPKMAMKKLVEVATEPMKPVDNDVFPKIPAPLQLTFVDVTESIESDYRGYFEHYNMKLLAYLFNSFEEMMLMDTDTVPLMSINEIFKLPQYQETSTLFYRDREVDIMMSDEASVTFGGLLNGANESSYLDLKKSSNKLSERLLKRKFKFLMESGLVLINRKERFDGVMASTMMVFFKPFQDNVHGEKEYFWLGQEVMGHEYRFNENYAVAVGELSFRASKGKEKQICSIHPAHVKDDRSSVVWMNSGFLVCKKSDAYSNDDDHDLRSTIWDKRRQYESPIIIRNAVVPRGVDGWKVSPNCMGFMWCAISAEVLNFKEADRKKWELLGKAWVDRYKRVRGN